MVMEYIKNNIGIILTAIYLIGAFILKCWLSYYEGQCTEKEKDGWGFPCMNMCIIVWPSALIIFPLCICWDWFENLGKKHLTKQEETSP